MVTLLNSGEKTIYLAITYKIGFTFLQRYPINSSSAIQNPTLQIVPEDALLSKTLNPIHYSPFLFCNFLEFVSILIQESSNFAIRDNAACNKTSVIYIVILLGMCLCCGKTIQLQNGYDKSDAAWYIQPDTVTLLHTYQTYVSSGSILN